MRILVATTALSLLFTGCVDPRLAREPSAMENGDADFGPDKNTDASDDDQNSNEDPLANVGALHRRERQRDVVDRDRHLHPGTQLAVQRGAAVRMVEGVANRGVHVLERRHRRLRVDDARAYGEIDLHQLVAAEQNAGLASVVDGHDAGMGTRHDSQVAPIPRSGRSPADPGRFRRHFSFFSQV